MRLTDLPFALFLARAHRRRAAWHILEHAGFGLLAGCGLSVIGLPVLALRGVEAIVPAIVILLIGAVLGMLAGLRRMPTRLGTAIELDRQLGTPDLLSSAYLMRISQQSSDARMSDASSFLGAMVAMSDDCVRDLSPASLLVRRFGIRAWSGIGLAGASVLIIALMLPGVATTTQATSELDASSTFAAQAMPEETASSGGSSRHVARRDDPSASGDFDRNHSRIDESDSRDTRIVPPQVNATPVQSPAAGSSAGRSDSTSAAPRVDPSHPSSPKETTTSNSTLAGSGIIGASQASTDRGDFAPGLITPGSSRIPAAPWGSSSWSTDRAAAMDAVRGGVIPDAYRDLVKDYFSDEK